MKVTIFLIIFSLITSLTHAKDSFIKKYPMTTAFSAAIITDYDQTVRWIVRGDGREALPGIKEKPSEFQMAQICLGSIFGYWLFEAYFPECAFKKFLLDSTLRSESHNVQVASLTPEGSKRQTYPIFVTLHWNF